MTVSGGTSSLRLPRAKQALRFFVKTGIISDERAEPKHPDAVKSRGGGGNLLIQAAWEPLGSLSVPFKGTEGPKYLSVTGSRILRPRRIVKTSLAYSLI